MLRIISIFVLLATILSARSVCYSANIADAEVGSLVVRSGAFSSSYLGHSAVVVGIENWASKKILMIQANGVGYDSGYVDFSGFLGPATASDYRGPARIKNYESSEAYRREVVRYAELALYKGYALLDLYDHGLFSYPSDIPVKNVIPVQFRCDGLVEWANEQARAHIESRSPSASDGYYPYNAAFNGCFPGVTNPSCNPLLQYNQNWLDENDSPRFVTKSTVPSISSGWTSAKNYKFLWGFADKSGVEVFSILKTTNQNTLPDPYITINIG